MPRISHSADEEQRLDRLAAQANPEDIHGEAFNHMDNLGDILGDSLIQEDHNYGSVLDEDNDQNMITIPATLLNDIMKQQQKLTDVTTEHNANALIAKLYECVASHYENGDRIGAEAILNAIGYVQQSS